VYHNTTADRFVTFFCGELNPVDRTFKYINAGHNPPLYIKSNGDVELLTLGGIILGVIENTDNYKTGEIKLNQGESITFFTDGITEATNKNLDEYGEKRLIEMIQKSKSGNSNELVKNILTDVKNHSKSFTQKDDITIVTLKVIEYTS
jgi:sigma-B regulation protein RsbU (phosphoserine phosphatase)